MNDRIETLLNEIDISPSLFADAIGVQRATISHILSGRNNPSLDFVQKVLARYPQLNPDWILSGKGDIWRDVSKLENVIESQKPVRTVMQPKQPGLFAEDGPAGLDPLKQFQTQTTDKKSVEKSGEQQTGQPKAIACSENAAEVMHTSREIVKVIVCYSDQTFEAFTGLRP